MARQDIDTKREAISIILLTNIVLNCLQNSYFCTHRYNHLSTFIKVALLCRRWKLTEIPITGKCSEKKKKRDWSAFPKWCTFITPFLSRSYQPSWKREQKVSKSQNLWISAVKHCYPGSLGQLNTGTNSGCNHMSKTCARSSQRKSQPGREGGSTIPPPNREDDC